MKINSEAQHSFNFEAPTLGILFYKFRHHHHVPAEITGTENKGKAEKCKRMVVEMQKCVLCKVPARTFCEPERASLCWDCDAKVHGANFLAARHSRILLCHACRSPTPWRASGARLNSTTVSVCDDCAAGEEEEEVSEGGNDEEVDTEDGVGDIQVVPWSSTKTPPPAASSSSGEWSLACTSKCNDNNIDVDDSVSEPLTTTVSLKRQRENDDAVDRDLQVYFKFLSQFLWF